MSELGMPFVHVVYEGEAGASRLSADQYAELPLSERIRCVLEGRARFIDAHGSEVESRAALAWLRERQAARAG